MTDFTTWKEDDLWEILSKGVGNIMTFGDFGRLTPEASMMHPVQEELERRGYTANAIQRRVANTLGIEVPVDT